MATREGYIGHHFGGLGENERSRIPIVRADSYNRATTIYSYGGGKDYHHYWTVNATQLQLDAYEYPTKVKISDYDGNGFHTGGPTGYGSPYLALGISSGDGIYAQNMYEFLDGYAMK